MMKVDIKSFIVGMLLSGVLIFSFGAGKTNLERKLEEEIADRQGSLALVRDSRGDALVVNLETAKARQVEYVNTNPPNNTVKLRVLVLKD